MASAKEYFSIKAGESGKGAEAKQFMKVLLKDWNIRIGITANDVSEERNFNKKVELPHPKDVNKLTSYVKTKLRQSNLTDQDQNWSTYSSIVTLVQTRLSTYNKRRPGEIESLL